MPEIPGIELTYEKGKLFISQRNYVKDLLEMYGMSDNNEVSSPVDVNQKLSEDEGRPMSD
ncbi:hypothetical protein K0M31_007193 [Melipona bicolor]|uniref:Uncharacterized protein n=1 Tax=Melipona bicolor TaxID=60889 RepID=A0AA40FRT1_9HYME|nr:hypothetical protein K0M31_007193 [Melipona bicolor]